MVEQKSVRSLSFLSRSDGHLARRTILSAERRGMMTIPAKIVPAQPASSKQPSSLSMQMPNEIGKRETLFNSDTTLNIFPPPLNLLMKIIF